MQRTGHMREIDSHFDAYEHLQHLPRGQEALLMLRKVASVVKPMMRKRGWKVGALAEFLPDEQSLLGKFMYVMQRRNTSNHLLGLNINKTERILLRLRYHHDSRQFLPLEQVTDTLLHELSHIVWGPHDYNFNNLWNELRDEHQSLLAKGYTGEGFLSSGHKLGGHRIPLDEMRRQARIAAQKRQAAAVNAGGHRLGGAKPNARGVDMRKVIADAATRRNSITSGCASGSAQAGELNNQATRGGIRTKADEDDANDLAIAQALQELMVEEEMAQLEQLGAPSGGGGLAWDRENGLQFDTHPPNRNPGVSSTTPTSTPKSRNRPSPGPQINSQGRPISRLVTAHENQKARARPPSNRRPSTSHSSIVNWADTSKPLPPSPNTVGSSASSILMSASPPSIPPSIPSDPTKWPCPQCTLLNPLNYLACDACGLEQPPQPIPPGQRYGTNMHTSTLPKPPPASGLRGPDATPFEPANGRIGWNCLNCGTFMEERWWTCSLCGEMKVDS